MKLKRLKKGEQYDQEVCAASRCKTEAAVVYAGGSEFAEDLGEVPLCDAHHAEIADDGETQTLPEPDIVAASPENQKSTRGRKPGSKNKPKPYDDLPTTDQVRALMLPREEDAKASVEFIRGKLVVGTPEQEQTAATMATEFARRHDDLDKERKRLTGPFRKVVESFNAACKPALNFYKEGEKLTKQKIGDYRLGLEQERQKALAAVKPAMDAGNQAEVHQLVQRAEDAAVPVPEGLKGAKVEWTGEVVDPSQIPRQYLVPNVKTLLSVTKAANADPNIPGWRAYPSTAVKISRK